MDMKQLEEQKRNEYLKDLARKAGELTSGHELAMNGVPILNVAGVSDFEQRRRERERKDDFRLAMQVMVIIGTRMEFDATPFTLELIKLCKEKL